MGKAYANRRSLQERPEADFYSTPYSLTWELINLQEFPLDSTIYEPACGSNAISSQLEKAGFNVICDDIRTTGKNFLECQDHFEYIVTNPPFSLFDEFVTKAKECSNKFAFIMKTNFLGATKRLEKGIWKGLKKLYIFDRQIDYRTPLLDSGELCVGNLITGWGIWENSWTQNYFETRIISVQRYCTLGSVESYLSKNLSK